MPRIVRIGAQLGQHRVARDVNGHAEVAVGRGGERGLPDRVRDLQHLVPMQRGGSAGEVAQAIVWLLSPEASYTTMSLVEVSGGR